MSLTINDPESRRLAQQLTDATGETRTPAVTVAIKEKRSRVRRAKRSEATSEELRAVAKQFRSSLKRPIEDLGTLLYDEKGLPE